MTSTFVAIATVSVACLLLSVQAQQFTSSALYWNDSPFIHPGGARRLALGTTYNLMWASKGITHVKVGVCPAADCATSATFINSKVIPNTDFATVTTPATNPGVWPTWTFGVADANNDTTVLQSPIFMFAADDDPMLTIVQPLTGSVYYRDGHISVAWVHRPNAVVAVNISFCGEGFNRTAPWYPCPIKIPYLRSGVTGGTYHWRPDFSYDGVYIVVGALEVAAGYQQTDDKTEPFDLDFYTEPSDPALVPSLPVAWSIHQRGRAIDFRWQWNAGSIAQFKLSILGSYAFIPDPINVLWNVSSVNQTYGSYVWAIPDWFPPARYNFQIEATQTAPGWVPDQATAIPFYVVMDNSRDRAEIVITKPSTNDGYPIPALEWTSLGAITAINFEICEVEAPSNCPTYDFSKPNSWSFASNYIRDLPENKNWRVRVWPVEHFTKTVVSEGFTYWSSVRSLDDDTQPGACPSGRITSFYYSPPNRRSGQCTLTVTSILATNTSDITLQGAPATIPFSWAFVNSYYSPKLKPNANEAQYTKFVADISVDLSTAQFVSAASQVVRLASPSTFYLPPVQQITLVPGSNALSFSVSRRFCAGSITNPTEANPLDVIRRVMNETMLTPESDVIWGQCSRLTQTFNPAVQNSIFPILARVTQQEGSPTVEAAVFQEVTGRCSGVSVQFPVRSSCLVWDTVNERVKTCPSQVAAKATCTSQNEFQTCFGGTTCGERYITSLGSINMNGAMIPGTIYHPPSSTSFGVAIDCDGQAYLVTSSSNSIRDQKSISTITTGSSTTVDLSYVRDDSGIIDYGPPIQSKTDKSTYTCTLQYTSAPPEDPDNESPSSSSSSTGTNAAQTTAAVSMPLTILLIMLALV